MGLEDQAPVAFEAKEKHHGATPVSGVLAAVGEDHLVAIQQDPPMIQYLVRAMGLNRLLLRGQTPSHPLMPQIPHR